MEMAIHCADLSTPARSFETCRKWTYLLFTEFFNGGDIEKSKGLPITYLSDRDTTKIQKSQPGFLGFIVLPLWA